MKKSITIFASIILMTLSANVIAQNTATAEATASARVMTMITLTSDDDGIEFGTFSSSNAIGTVTIAATSAGARSANGGITLSEVLGTHSSAQFTITGEENATYEIDLPSTVTISNGTQEMNISNFTSNASGIIAGGSETFFVGATLNVEAGQASGDYEGEYEVTVSYN